MTCSEEVVSISGVSAEALGACGSGEVVSLSASGLQRADHTIDDESPQHKGFSAGKNAVISNSALCKFCKCPQCKLNKGLLYIDVITNALVVTSGKNTDSPIYTHP